MHFCVYLETLFVSRLRVQRYAFFLNLQAFGRFFSRKSAFFYCSPPFSFLLGSFFCLFVSFRPLPVSLSPFVLFLFLPFLCRFCFSCIFLLSRLLFCVLPFFCYSYFLFLISYFSLFPFSFLFISFVYDCPLFCLRCGRELRSIGKLRCRAGIDAVCKKGAERVIPFLCPLRIFHQPGILLPVPRALGYHIYCQSSSLYFSQRLLQCHVPGSL